MQLTCPSCQSACILPAAFSRFFDMPIRCQACTNHFDVPRSPPSLGLTAAVDPLPADNHASGNHIGRSSFDQSISARRNHHSITCAHCRKFLLLAGKDRPPHPVQLTCPACQQSFTHNPAHQLTWRGAALTVLFAAVIFALSVLALDHYQLISLAQLEAWQWLVDITGRIGARLSGIELGWAGLD